MAALQLLTRCTQMLIFDVRFGDTPLHILEGHINDYRRPLVSLS